ncbi:unnamed protein product [Nesidiocoris tenuis]|uniref:Uncharacterized protein n=1 Tax=Nesidiocoris tenuis TaxID=355587 RepID=A0A6H5GZQ0_9HEMI|nr:unnamed protein product [Nesidiocoris tenuis]
MKQLPHLSASNQKVAAPRSDSLKYLEKIIRAGGQVYKKIPSYTPQQTPFFYVEPKTYNLPDFFRLHHGQFGGLVDRPKTEKLDFDEVTRRFGIWCVGDPMYKGQPKRVEVDSSSIVKFDQFAIIQDRVQCFRSGLF